MFGWRLIAWFQGAFSFRLLLCIWGIPVREYQLNQEFFKSATHVSICVGFPTIKWHCAIYQLGRKSVKYIQSPPATKQDHLAFGLGGWLKVGRLVSGVLPPPPGYICFAGLSLLLGTWGDPKRECWQGWAFFGITYEFGYVCGFQL